MGQKSNRIVCWMILAYFVLVTAAIVLVERQSAPRPVPTELRIEAAEPAPLNPYPELQGVLLDLNTATAEELQQLPQIGASRAQAIIDYRQQQAFTSVDQLDNVDGIGASILEQLRPYVTVTPAA